MKRLLICLVALIAVFALVMPTYAAEMKVNGIWNAKAYARDNYDGDDDSDDSVQYVTQRMRMYFNFIASENLKLVYKNEIDIEWGDSARGTANRNDGGALDGDTVNLETKNVYLEFMVPDTPVKATMGLQGITMHKGWFAGSDYSAAKFDMNFDPISITTYWAGLGGLFQNDSATATTGEDVDASNDNWQIVASGAYKAENLDARLSFGYERRPNDAGRNPSQPEDPESDDLFLIMGELNMSFDMVSFFVIAGKNFGEVKSDVNANDRDYKGYMVDAGVNFALDMATIRARAFMASGDKEGDFEDDFQVMTGAVMSWSELMSDGYTYDRNPGAALASIGGANKPSNMYAINVGADFKPTDTTTIKADIYYIGMLEDRTIAGQDEDEIGTEIDVSLTQKIYDTLSMTVIGAYLMAEDGYGAGAAATNSGDDAFQVGVGLDFKF